MLHQLADRLRFPSSFFYRPEPAELPQAAASFRALSKMTARERDRALAAGSLAFELQDWLMDRFELPIADLPDLRGAEPEAAAQMLRARWGLGEDPIDSMVHLLEAKGVRVFSLAEDTANVDAFSLWRGSTPFVFLNTRKTAERDRMDAAHELGHLVLHRDHDAPRGRDREREAELFAGAFLMPRASVIALAPSAPTLGNLIALKRIWRVSVAALVYRLDRLGLLSEWRSRQLWVEIGKRGYRSREPEGIQRESSQLLWKTFSSLRAEGVGWNDIASALGLYADDLDALVFGLVAVALPGGNETWPARPPDLQLVRGAIP